jgi:tRNA dimethylallyltransferase
MAVSDVEPIGRELVEAKLGGDRLRKDREPARDERRRRTSAPHCRDQRGRTRRQANPRRRFFEHPNLHPPEERDARLERGREVDLAVHRLPGDFGNPAANPEAFGQLVEHLVLDDRRFEIGNEDPFAPSGARLEENIDPGAVDYGPRRFFDWPRTARVEDEIAGLAGGEPVRFGPDPQGRGDRRDEAGETRPAADPGDQGKHHPHQPASYSRKRIRHKPARASDGAPPVLVIAGPTASGKSTLALALAEVFDGTIINADSLQIYRDLRILTARPDAITEQRAPHRLYGFLDAAERGTVAHWRMLALDELAAATRAGRLPILVGGTGLYIRALEHGLAPVPEIPEEIRREAVDLHRLLGGVGFRERLAQFDPAGAQRLFPGDRQRLVRAFEVVRATGVPLATWQRRTRPSSAYRFRIILLMPPREDLYAACDTRFVRMIEADALGEAAALAARGLDPGLPAMKAVGVPELLRYLRGEMPLADTIAAAQRATRQYAKRQMTWFRHQAAPNLRLDQPFSEGLLRRSRRFVHESVLTG